MSDSLHVEIRGQGQDLVLVHGWAMHGGIWPNALLIELEKNFRLHIIDLPGHGYSAVLENEFTLSAVTDVLYQYANTHIDSSASWLGWSLGGLFAANMAAMYPDKVNKLVLVASSLCFSKKQNWLHAMDADVLELFATQLCEDYRNTLSRFLALQFKGDTHARESLRNLREQLFSRGEPDKQSLEAGLNILLKDDLRPQISNILQPTLLLGGEYDSLTPVAALDTIVSQFAQAKLSIIKGAGHAPFISHAEIFQQQLMPFIDV